MRHNLKIVLFGLSAAIAVLFCIKCAPVAGTATETENISAMLYNPGGSPAASAKVCFYRHGDDPRNNHAVDSTYTDNNGNYSKKLDTGTYNILASLGSNATFQDSITVTKGDTTRPAPDTLKSLGSISGRIELQGTDDPRTVFILFMGSNTFTRPTDLAGNFSATNMAKGKYPVTLLTTLDNYDVMDTSFVIKAGVDSVIPQPIVMKYTGIPVPRNLQIQYDTMKQIVTLIWNRPVSGRPLNGYNVYRRNVDSNTTLSTINTQLVTDTTYKDSSGVQDMTYEYRVTAVDTTTTEGTRSAAISIKITTAFGLVDSVVSPDFQYISQIKKSANGGFIGISYHNEILVMDSTFHIVRRWGSMGTGTGQFNSPYSLVLDSKGNIFVADMRNDRIQEFDTLGNFLMSWGTTGTGDGQFRNPQYIDIDKNDRIYISERLNDRVQEFNADGSFIRKFGSTGSGSGEFDIITGIAVDSNGIIFVSDFNNARIQKFDSLGNFVEQWNGINAPSCLMSNGKAIICIVNSGTGFDAIELLNLNGSVIATAQIQGIIIGFVGGYIYSCVQGVNPVINIFKCPLIR